MFPAESKPTRLFVSCQQKAISALLQGVIVSS